MCKYVGPLPALHAHLTPTVGAVKRVMNCFFTVTKHLGNTSLGVLSADVVSVECRGKFAAAHFAVYKLQVRWGAPLSKVYIGSGFVRHM